METRKSPRANLEKQRAIFFEIGLVLTLACVLLAFEWKSQTKTVRELAIPQSQDLAEEIIPITEHKKEPPKVQIPKTVVVINIVDDDEEILDDIIIDAEATEATMIEEYVPIPFVEEVEEEPAEGEIFMVVESMPEYPGGLNTLYDYLYEHLVYPHMAKEAGISGRVFVSFVVEVDGSVSNVEVLRGIGGGCDEEALKVIREMPRWIPGKQRGVAVRVRYNLPIKFTLL